MRNLSKLIRAVKKEFVESPTWAPLIISAERELKAAMREHPDLDPEWEFHALQNDRHVAMVEKRA